MPTSIRHQFVQTLFNRLELDLRLFDQEFPDPKDMPTDVSSLATRYQLQKIEYDFHLLKHHRENEKQWHSCLSKFSISKKIPTYLMGVATKDFNETVNMVGELFHV